MEWERDAKKRTCGPASSCSTCAREAGGGGVPWTSSRRATGSCSGRAPRPSWSTTTARRPRWSSSESANSKPVAAWLLPVRSPHRPLLRPGEAGRPPLGFDPPERYFYFAVEVYPTGDAPKTGPVTLELSRVRAERHCHRLADDARAAEAEAQLAHPGAPLQPRRQRSSPSSSTTSGATRGDAAPARLRDRPREPEGRHLPRPVLRLRRDLLARRPLPSPRLQRAGGARPDRSRSGSRSTGATQGHRLIQRFVLSPSGRSFLLFSNTILGLAEGGRGPARRGPRAPDLGADPAPLPRPRRRAPRLVSTADGRLLVASICEKSGFPSGTGVRIFEVPDDVESPAPAGTAPGGAPDRAGGRPRADPRRRRPGSS